MGVDLKDLVVRKPIRISQLSGRKLAIDGYNALYQFLTVIRQPDGTPLKDSQGRVTSHLSGLFYRTVNLMEDGIKPVYVFDGKPPEIKEMEIERRRLLRREAAKKYEEAVARGDLEAARIYAMQAARLTEDMVSEAKELLDAMGIPWVQAPSEGEAQAAHLARKGDVWASVSQDYDSLLYGAPRLVRNLTISGRRKKPRSNVYIEISPELIVLDETLRSLGVSREQLIDIAILIGTDYNPDGVKGVGPKTALKLIKTYGSLEKALKKLPQAKFPVDPEEIRRIFLEPVVTDKYTLKWRPPDKEKIIRVLVDRHDFSMDRVERAVERAVKAYRTKFMQRGLESWFG